MTKFGEEYAGWEIPLRKCPKCGNDDLKLWINFGFNDFTDVESIFAELVEVEPCPKCGHKFDVKLPMRLKRKQ